jgi:hypothetical protein
LLLSILALNNGLPKTDVANQTNDSLDDQGDRHNAERLGHKQSRCYKIASESKYESSSVAKKSPAAGANHTKFQGNRIGEFAGLFGQNDFPMR